jgi:predicted DNA-binding transcriptional regulator AlpA
MSEQPTTKPVWLSPKEVAQRLPGVTVGNLSELRKKRKGPAFYKPTERTVLYLESEIEAWVAAHRVETRGGAA